MFCACAGLTAGCDKGAAEAGAGEGKGSAADAGDSEAKPELPPLTAAQLEKLYVDSKARYEATETLPDASFQAIKDDLMRVANEAEDVHLRANASLLLGSLHEDRSDSRSAISFYRQAAELAPGEVGTHIVLALALSKDQQWEPAIVEQWKVVEMIPDDLMGWLLLGELHVKGGKLDEAAKVYGAYEMRRRGLLDGLTLQQDGAYLKDEAERVACAEALVVANDNGTSMGLLYALDSEPSPVVRERIAAIMGEQRLLGYRKLLETKLGSEENEAVKKAMEWAIAEIDRDPVETAPGAVPDEIAADVAAEADRLAKEAAAPTGGAAATGGAEPAEGAANETPKAGDAQAADGAEKTPPPPAESSD